MMKSLAILSLPILLLATPASAATKEQKKETCTFGADDAKLEGAKRNTFMAKCMSNRDDKRGPAMKPSNEMAPASDKKG